MLQSPETALPQLSPEDESAVNASKVSELDVWDKRRKRGDAHERGKGEDERADDDPLSVGAAGKGGKRVS